MFPAELYRVALEKEFALSYHSSLGGVASWQNLPVSERDWHYHRLADQKAEEKEKREEERRELKSRPTRR